MSVIADGLVRLIAPILPVTADELWHHLPGTREERLQDCFLGPGAIELDQSGPQRAGEGAASFAVRFASELEKVRMRSERLEISVSMPSAGE